jgi:RNA polymerase sigma-70 factor (ECF subfamily)
MTGPETRLSLLARLRQPSDQEAWREFTAIYQPLIQRLAIHRGFQDADAQEVAQEVLLAVSGAIDRWQPDPQRASFRTWLFRIARNLMINLLKHKQRLPRAIGGTEMLELLDQQPAPDDDSEWFDHEFRRELFRWSAERIRVEFRESTWQAFWRTCVEGEGISAVASSLHLSVGAVYVARSRVMARLKQVIEQKERESRTW